MNDPDSYRDQNNQHGHDSLYNYGRDAANNGWSSPSQQSNESSREYEIRQQSYEWHRQNAGH